MCKRLESLKKKIQIKINSFERSLKKDNLKELKFIIDSYKDVLNMIKKEEKKEFLKEKVLNEIKRNKKGVSKESLIKIFKTKEINKILIDLLNKGFIYELKPNLFFNL